MQVGRWRRGATNCTLGAGRCAQGQEGTGAGGTRRRRARRPPARSTVRTTVDGGSASSATEAPHSTSSAARSRRRRAAAAPSADGEPHAVASALERDPHLALVAVLTAFRRLGPRRASCDRGGPPIRAAHLVGDGSMGMAADHVSIVGRAARRARTAGRARPRPAVRLDGRAQPSTARAPRPSSAAGCATIRPAPRSTRPTRPTSRRGYAGRPRAGRRRHGLAQRALVLGEPLDRRDQPATTPIARTQPGREPVRGGRRRGQQQDRRHREPDRELDDGDDRRHLLRHPVEGCGERASGPTDAEGAAPRPRRHVARSRSPSRCCWRPTGATTRAVRIRGRELTWGCGSAGAPPRAARLRGLRPRASSSGRTTSWATRRSASAWAAESKGSSRYRRGRR